MRLINLAGLETIQKDVTTALSPVKLSPYYKATTIAFNNNSGTPPTVATRDTITDSDSKFVSEGFKAGDMFVVSGSTSNDGQYKIYSVTAGTLTLEGKADASVAAGSGLLTTEIAGDTITAETLLGVKIPDGVRVIVKAKKANTGDITIAKTSARALSTATGYFSNHKLDAGDLLELDVKNLNALWIDATVSGEGVEIAFEH